MERQSDLLDVLESVKGPHGPAEESADTLHLAGAMSYRSLAGANGHARVTERPVPMRELPSAPGAPDDDLLRDLLGFFRSGRVPAWSDAVRYEDLLPVALDGYRDLARLRLDYPVVLLDEPGSHDSPPAVPLRDLLDELARRLPEGEERERMTNDLLRLEAVIRSLEPRPGERLTARWDRAQEKLLDRVGGSEREKLEARLGSYRSDFAVDGIVLECGSEGTRRLFDAVARRVAGVSAEGLVERIDKLIEPLRQTLLLCSRSDSDMDVVRGTLGLAAHTDIDAGALADLIRGAHLGNPLEKDRRRRISESVAMLAALRQALGEPTLLWEDSGRRVESSDSAANEDGATSASIETQIAGYRRRVASYVAALRIAELEVANLYREEKHDATFADFQWRDVRQEEAAAFPPLVVTIDAARVGEGDRTLCLDLLVSGLPVKVLVLLDEVLEYEAVANTIEVSWWARLGMMASSSYSAYVMQTVSADVACQLEGFSEGLQSGDPALFCIYTGGDPERTGPLRERPPHERGRHFAHSPLHLLSDAARDSRVFSSFRYNPAAGTDLAARMRIDGNPEPELEWTHDELAVKTAEDASVIEPFAFTAADFTALIPDLHAHFLPVPPDRRGDVLLPLSDWLSLDPAQKDRRVPMIESISPEGGILPVAVSWPVAAFAAGVADRWRRLQELGGAANSHAEAVLDEQRARLREEHEKELAALRAAHEEEIRRASAAATEEIISNIAAGLLSMPATPVGAAASIGSRGDVVARQPARGEEAVTGSTPAPTGKGDGSAAPAVEVASPAAAPDDTDDDLSFDDPYIDTPLCTTCNECTRLNGLLFAYNADQQAEIKDPDAGTYRELVTAAELCPVHIIHPGKPRNPAEPGLPDLLKRAEPYL